MLPQEILHAISQLEGGHIVFVIGAGCSVDGPTHLPLSDECALEAHRRLVADGVLAAGECSNPADLSCVADTVIAKTGRQDDLVLRLPRERFRKARPNSGHLLAAAMLRERALSCVMTLNFDLAMTSALVEVGGDEVHVIARPEEFRFLGTANLVYLHCNVEAEPAAWILSSEALDKGWRNGWQEMIAQRFLASPVTVFVGLGTPAGVLLESAHRVRCAMHEGASVFQVDPGTPESSAFFAELAISREKYIQMGWIAFMQSLAGRLTEEQIRLLGSSCDGLIKTEGWCIDLQVIEQICQRVMGLGLLGFGKLRARSILEDGNYLPNCVFTVEWLADLLLGIHHIESIADCEARICEDGVVEFMRDNRLVGVTAIVNGRGVRRWLTIETEINQYQDYWRHHLSKPRCVLASGITDSRPSHVAPPEQLVGGEDESIVCEVGRPDVYTVDEIRRNSELVWRFIS